MAESLPLIEGQGLQGYPAPFKQSFDIQQRETSVHGDGTPVFNDQLPYDIRTPIELPMKKVYLWNFTNVYYALSIKFFEPLSNKPTQFTVGNYPVDSPIPNFFWNTSSVDAIRVSFVDYWFNANRAETPYPAVAPFKFQGNVYRITLDWLYSTPVPGSAYAPFAHIYFMILSTQN
jgi:hypothetical protein